MSPSAGVEPAAHAGGPGTTSVPLLACEVAGRRLALRAAEVREVVRAVAVAPLPRAPDVVDGLINLRGEPVPVLDVRRRFGLAASEVLPGQHFVVARAGARTVALRVDRALELLEVPEEAIRSAEPAVSGAEGVEGIAVLPDGLLVIHDLTRFLSPDDAAALDEARRGDHRRPEGPQ